MSALYKAGTVAWVRSTKDSEWILAYARGETWVYLLAGTTQLGNGSISPLTAPAQIRIVHLPDITEPEDKDDLYVEPEPLKEGDAVLVWAKVVDPEQDELGDFAIDVMYGSTFDRTFARTDAIVRPADGQVPPWVKPARCTSLYLVVGEDVYIRCHNPEGHVGVHGAQFSPGFKQWSGPGDGVTVEGGAS